MGFEYIDKNKYEGHDYSHLHFHGKKMKNFVHEEDQSMASTTLNDSEHSDDGEYDSDNGNFKQSNDPLLFQYDESIPLFQSGYELHTSCSSSILPTSSQSSEKSQEILPLSQSTTRIIQSNNNNTDRNLKVSDFYANGTWQYGFDDLNAAVKNSTNNLVPASDVDIDGFYSALAFNALVFIIFMLSYEILRRLFPNVYASRKKESIPSFQAPSLLNKIDEGGSDDNLEMASNSNATEETPAAPQHYWTDLPDINDLQSPFQWVGPVFSVPWHRVRQVAGLDAYFFLRYIRLCFRITTVSAFWGIVILWPIYATGSNNASGWYHFSLANVTTGSWRIWAGTSFLYMFTLYVFFVMKQEYKHYIELRLEFLGKGETGIHPQHHYSVMVERIPQQLRSDAALFGYFNRLFPGKVHSANVLLNLPELNALSKRKMRVKRRLEKSIAYYYATEGKRPTHIMGRPRFMCMGIEGAPSEIPCCCCCQESRDVYHLEGYDPSTEPKRGERVDSITYYTHDLIQCNSNMYEMQKQKAIIAERGNVAITSMGWFEKIDIFTDTAVSRLNEEYDPGRHNSEPLGEPIRMGSGRALGAYGGLVPRKPNIIHFKRSWIDSGGKALKESSIQRVGEGDTEKNQLYGSILDSNGLGEGLEEGREKMTVTGRKTTSDFTTNSSDVAKPMAQTPKSPFRSPKYKKKIPDAPNAPASSLGAVIFESTSDDMASSSSGSKDQRLIDEDFMEEEDNYEAAHDFALSAERAIQKRGFISKLLGRLGVDFALYGVKLLNRQLAKLFDRVVGTSTMSSTGFVTFLDLSSLTCAASAPLTHKPNTLNVKVAPEPMDIKWHNAHVPTDVADRRAYNANLLLTLGALLWSIPLAAIQALASAEKLAQIPGMDWILTYNSGSLKLFINVYLPVVALLGLIMLLPIIFEGVAVQYEKRKTKSDVERSIIDRYFYYQLANIYITVTAGSLWTSLSDIISQPSEVFEILGKTLPMVVGYFVSLLSTKILAGLPMIILRPGALARYFFLRLTYKQSHLSQTELDRVYREEELLYGWEYPTLLLVIVICFTYVSISPVILIFGSLYFIGSLLVHKKQVLYVYTPQYESGGSMFPLVCDRTLIGLICGQLIYIGYIVVIRSGYYQIIVLFPLVYLTIYMMNYFRQNYADPSDRLTLERAKELDEFLDKKASLAMNEPLRPGLGARLLEQIFTKEHYKQNVMTESAGEPVSYRPGCEDELTREAIEKIRASRDRLTEDMNVYPYGTSSEEAAS